MQKVLARQTIRRTLGVALLALGLPATAVACLWDYDTLKQERARFPDTLELITGKFLRHSPEFYEWRIKDRLVRLTADPENLSFHDDLAVAYSKVGRHADAIATMHTKEKIKPGLYETYSNLGTFHILAGDFEAGLPYIDRALAINPDAHFGREKYQKWLVEYSLTCKKKDGKLVLPLQRKAPNEFRNFYYFLQQKGEGLQEKDRVALSENAVHGVLGMMRFANHEHPLLLEALADLVGGDIHQGQRIAARCYLKASYVVNDDAIRREYRRRADYVLGMQTGSRRPSDTSHPNLEDDFKAELADAQRWYSELHVKELGWIRDKKNVEAEFDRLYTVAPEVPLIVLSEFETHRPHYGRMSDLQTLGLTLGVVGVFGIIFLVVRRRAARRRLAALDKASNIPGERPV